MSEREFCEIMAKRLHSTVHPKLEKEDVDSLRKMVKNQRKSDRNTAKALKKCLIECEDTLIEFAEDAKIKNNVYWGKSEQVNAVETKEQQYIQQLEQKVKQLKLHENRRHKDNTSESETEPETESESEPETESESEDERERKKKRNRQKKKTKTKADKKKTSVSAIEEKQKELEERSNKNNKKRRWRWWRKSDVGSMQCM